MCYSQKYVCKHSPVSDLKCTDTNITFPEYSVIHRFIIRYNRQAVQDKTIMS